MSVHAVVKGRLSKDGEIKQVGTDNVLRLNVASDFYAGPGKGRPKSDGSPGNYGTIWVSVDVWGKRADNVAAKAKKGTTVLVRGELKQREYNGKTYLEMRADDVEVLVLNGSAPADAGGDYGAPGDEDIAF